MRFIPPQLASLSESVPADKGWSFEVKYDGYRMQAHLDRGHVKLFTRRGLNWTDRFPALVGELSKLRISSAILDGEIVSPGSGDRPFQRLQQALDAADSHELVYYAFDLLALDGKDVRDVPLRERRRALSALLARRRGRIRLGEELSGPASTLLAAACRTGLEGIICKRIDAPYRSGRGDAWRKVKCGRRQEFVIVGFTDPQGSRSGIGALLLGVHEGAVLRYAGKVGTGFSASALDAIRRKLHPLIRATPAVKHLKGKLPSNAHWVKPKLVGEVAFTEWTEEGLLRHPSFQGLREDKPSTAVIRERLKSGPAAKQVTGETMIAGIEITHPDRIVYPELGLTKLDVARYYDRIAPLMLPHVKGRPLSLVRCPSGSGKECFFQKHWVGKLPDAIDTVMIKQSDGKRPHVVVNDRKGLVTLAQWGVMEIHLWGARADDPERPDRIVFDLDPGDGVKWTTMREAAQIVRELLKASGLKSWIKTTGGKGLHVVAPIERRASWDRVKEFAKHLADLLEQEAPDRFVAKASKAARPGRIYIDYLRNSRGATWIAPWSLRARPDAGISMPFAWTQLAKITAGTHLTLPNFKRLPTSDAWKDLLTTKQKLKVKR